MQLKATQKRAIINDVTYRKQKFPPRTLPDFVPWPDARPDDVPDWADEYLTHLAINGGIELAANHVRMHRISIHRLRHACEPFDDAVQRALEYYADSLEWHLVEQAHKTGVPLGFFGRLKAERPARWLDKSLVASLEVTAEIHADQVQEFLGSLVQHVTPTTRALLGLSPPQDPDGGTIGGKTIEPLSSPPQSPVQ